MALKINSNINRTILGAFLRDMRIVQRMTQEQLAKRLSASQGIINAYEIGKTVPPLMRLVQLADVLDFPVVHALDLVETDPEFTQYPPSDEDGDPTLLSVMEDTTTETDC